LHLPLPGMYFSQMPTWLTPSSSSDTWWKITFAVTLYLPTYFKCQPLSLTWYLLHFPSLLTLSPHNSLVYFVSFTPLEYTFLHCMGLFSISFSIVVLSYRTMSDPLNCQ
jgi:hypothetical protein